MLWFLPPDPAARWFIRIKIKSGDTHKMTAWPVFAIDGVLASYPSGTLKCALMRGPRQADRMLLAGEHRFRYRDRHDPRVRQGQRYRYSVSIHAFLDPP